MHQGVWGYCSTCLCVLGGDKPPQSSCYILLGIILQPQQYEYQELAQCNARLGIALPISFVNYMLHSSVLNTVSDHDHVGFANFIVGDTMRIRRSVSGESIFLKNQYQTHQHWHYYIVESHPIRLFLDQPYLLRKHL